LAQDGFEEKPSAGYSTCGIDITIASDSSRIMPNKGGRSAALVFLYRERILKHCMQAFPMRFDSRVGLS
jgi:hypothetical protein